MNSLNRYFTLCFLVLCAWVTCPTSGFAQGKLEWQTCVKFDNLFSAKQGCYVLDMQTKEKKIVVQIGVGINVNVGSVVIGGGGSSMLVVTTEYPATGDSKQDIEKAVQKFETELKKPANKEKILDLYKKSGAQPPEKAPEKWDVHELKALPVSDLPLSIRSKIRVAMTA